MNSYTVIEIAGIYFIGEIVEWRGVRYRIIGFDVEDGFPLGRVVNEAQ